MNPLITLELSFAKSDVQIALRNLRIAQTRHVGRRSSLDFEIKTLERVLDSLARIDRIAATQPLTSEEA